MSPPPHLDPAVFDDTVAAVALLVGPEGRLVYTNSAFTRMFGARQWGLPAREAFPDPDAGRFLSVLDEVRATGRARQVTGAREPDRGAPSQARYFVYSCSPVTTAEGDGILVVAMDTTTETFALQRYQALVSAVSVMVWVLHADGGMEEIVAGWEQLTGVPWHPRADVDWYARIHPRDRERLSEGWRDAATRGVGGVFQCTFRVRAADGSYRHMSTRSVPVLREGRVAEWIAATVDIEDTWRAQLRERLLARVATVTGQSLGEAFGEVVKVVVPELTDACLILLLSHDEWPLPEHARVTARRVASATRPGLHAPPALRGQSVTLSRTVREVLESRVPRTFAVPAGGPVPADLVPAVTERWLVASGATSLTLIPLVVDDTVLGYAATSTNGDTPALGPTETDLLREVLHHAQQPIRKALDLQRARRTALALQRAQLTRPPTVHGASLAASYQPASSANEIGGDWYDAFLLPDGTLVLDVGDVVGHDLAAATAMTQMRNMLRALAYSRGSVLAPAEVLARFDEVAEGLGATPFATAVHAQLRRLPDLRWHVTWSNAGHPPPLLIPAHGDPVFLTGAEEDLPLCVDLGLPRSTHSRVLGTGDTLLLYTDGLVETPAASLTDGQRRLAHEAALRRQAPLPELLHGLQDLSDHRDDTAMIAFRADPPL
ncbi:SpoIIE family protein phosphatase [Streptomyces sp. NBC_00094]|uniref:SpoIIE family protein phosphatase n=1 Tax=Streptomyces sp. NBC_00094 TaxID=2903620 RepID=UPI00225406D7|nr:SpoIIE family protein phosphatase [Streptomyces sp. NBC_00094]MCX5395237.1 SpoIIE family protein phosphatase [Streptomyces sp. NBC_00094]